jgi:hypothetical protein
MPTAPIATLAGPPGGGGAKLVDMSIVTAMMMAFRFVDRAINDKGMRWGFREKAESATAPATVSGKFFSTRPLGLICPGRRKQSIDPQVRRPA